MVVHPPIGIPRAGGPSDNLSHHDTPVFRILFDPGPKSPGQTCSRQRYLKNSSASYEGPRLGRSHGSGAVRIRGRRPGTVRPNPEAPQILGLDGVSMVR